MKTFFLFFFFISFAVVDAQTPGNTNPGTTTPDNRNIQQQPPVQTGTFYTTPINPPAGQPTGTHGTDMTDPNTNGAYEVNPDARPRDNFQSQPNTTPTGTQVPRRRRQ